MSGFAVEGQGSDGLLTPGGHEGVDHTAAPFNLLSDGAHDAVDHTAAPFNLLEAAAHLALDHSSIPGVNPNQVSPAERTAGAEGNIRSFSPFDIATMAGLHGLSLQVAMFDPATFTWSNSAAAISTGALAFTPLVCFAMGAFNHSLTSLAVSTDASTLTFGVATGTGSNAKSMGQMADRTGSADTEVTTYDNNSIAGVSAHGDSGAVSFKSSWDLADVDVSAFAAGGIELTPSAALTGVITLVVLGVA